PPAHLSLPPFPTRRSSDLLRIKLLGVVPESENVLHASNQGLPAIHLKETDVSEAYQDIVARYLGEERVMRFVEYSKPGFLKRLLDRKSTRLNSSHVKSSYA